MLCGSSHQDGLRGKKLPLTIAARRGIQPCPHISLLASLCEHCEHPQSIWCAANSRYLFELLLAHKGKQSVDRLIGILGSNIPKCRKLMFGWCTGGAAACAVCVCISAGHAGGGAWRGLSPGAAPWGPCSPGHHAAHSGGPGQEGSCRSPAGMALHS